MNIKNDATEPTELPADTFVQQPAATFTFETPLHTQVPVIKLSEVEAAQRLNAFSSDYSLDSFLKRGES